MTIKDRVKLLCSNKNMTVQQLESALSISNGTISKWGSSKPSLDNFISVAVYFGVDPVYLATGEPLFSSSTSSEDSLVNSFRSLNAEGQEKVLSYVNDLTASGIYKRGHSNGMVEKEA